MLGCKEGKRKERKRKERNRKENIFLDIRVYLRSIYFAETKIFLLKVL